MKDSSRLLRKQIFLAAYAAGAGHLASAFSCVEIIDTLYCGGVMQVDPSNPDWDERDLFVLSKGHASLALYAVLAKRGFFPESELYHFCRPGSFLGGEPNTLEICGVDASTGSLGHGPSIALGMALALKTDKKPNRVYCLAGDGECQEGSVWEALIMAPSFHLENLTLIVDNNHIQKMDTLQAVIGSDALGQQLEQMGWSVRYADGHNEDALKNTLMGEWDAGKPRCLIAETVKGKGLTIMENNPAWHWRMPNKRELAVFCDQLQITKDELAAVKG